MYLSIGQLASKTRESVKTLRYWTDLELLDVERADNSYRYFPPSMVERVDFIRSAQTLGFNLHEIKSILKLREDSISPCKQVRNNLRSHLEQVRTRIQELKSLEHELEARLRWAEDNPIPDCNAEGCIYLTLVHVS